jgi:ribosomal-protein-alanine N-acetyltransferase
VLTTSRLVLRAPVRDDADRISAYFARNAARFAPWMNDTTLGLNGTEWVGWQQAKNELGRAKTFLLLAQAELAGIVELDAISTGAGASAILAYSLDADYEGQGLASEAVAAVIAYAFDELRLEVLIAHFHPENQRSRALLERAGFTVQQVVAEVPSSVRGLMQPRATAQLCSPGSGLPGR